MVPDPADHHDAGQAPSLLAAIILHVLLTDPRELLDVEQATSACERDPAVAEDLEQVRDALHGLVRDGLAEQHGQAFRASRAAIRADQLSF
jgi:hypothetical protein